MNPPPGGWPRGSIWTGSKWVTRVCQDCDVAHPPSYMVKSEIWLAAGFTNYSDGLCCLRCLGKRLGRPVTVDDLNNSDLNEWWRREHEIKGSLL